MHIIGEASVSCYVDAVAMLIMFLLLILSERIRKQRNQEFHLFFLLSLAITATCILCFVFNAMNRQTAPWCHTVALVSRTFRECFVIVDISLWNAYLVNKLYGSVNRRAPQMVLLNIFIVVFFILQVVNLFTGIIFSISEENKLQPTLLFYIIMAFEFVYFMFSGIVVKLYDRKTMKKRFIRVTPMALSVGAAILPQFFTPYDTGIMGFAIGVILLYFSMVSELRFVDEESGLYNTGYLSHLFDLAISGKNTIKSALIFEIEGNVPVGMKILRDNLQLEGDVIRQEKRKCLMFSNSDSNSTMQYLSSLVEEAAEKYNTAHPDDKIVVTARCRMKNEGEDAFNFLHAVAEEKDVGDSVRGIVSMMSELDRLDKELSLAADIQINILPRIFPPFPDRKEFDIYASMTPAKEVGGDFYDFFLIDDDHLGMVIADVSGKGIPAALFMMISKTLLKNNLMSGLSTTEALEKTNSQLCERNSSMMFVTIWMAVMEISTGKGLACNAGHENPAIRHAPEMFELLKYKHDPVVGVMEKAKYQAREFELCPGDCLFVYTDGVPEATDPEGNMFGEERLCATLNENADASPEDLVIHVHESVDRFKGDAMQFDDITMLCLKYYGKQDMTEGSEQV